MLSRQKFIFGLLAADLRAQWFKGAFEGAVKTIVFTFIEEFQALGDVLESLEEGSCVVQLFLDHFNVHEFLLMRIPPELPG